MRFLLILSLLFTLVFQSAIGQTKAIINPNEDLYKSHQLKCADLTVSLPSDFISSGASDEFVFQEKGSVMKFAYVKDIPTSQFCDSMTTSFFEVQGLSDVAFLEDENVSIYKGKFEINTVPYIRAFCVYPLEQSTLLCIVNYPELIEEEFAFNFKTLIMDCQDE